MNCLGLKWAVWPTRSRSVCRSVMMTNANASNLATTQFLVPFKIVTTGANKTCGSNPAQNSGNLDGFFPRTIFSILPCCAKGSRNSPCGAGKIWSHKIWKEKQGEVRLIMSADFPALALAVSKRHQLESPLVNEYLSPNSGVLEAMRMTDESH